jgi:hypothetical protein
MFGLSIFVAQCFVLSAVQKALANAWVDQYCRTMKLKENVKVPQSIPIGKQ